MTVDLIIFPVPIRDGVTVKISDLPTDLTVEEADKIAAVVKALSGRDCFGRQHMAGPGVDAWDNAKDD